MTVLKIITIAIFGGITYKVTCAKDSDKENIFKACCGGIIILGCLEIGDEKVKDCLNKLVMK